MDFVFSTLYISILALTLGIVGLGIYLLRKPKDQKISFGLWFDLVFVGVVTSISQMIAEAQLIANVGNLVGIELTCNAEVKIFTSNSHYAYVIYYSTLLFIWGSVRLLVRQVMKARLFLVILTVGMIILSISLQLYFTCPVNELPPLYAPPVQIGLQITNPHIN